MSCLCLFDGYLSCHLAGSAYTNAKIQPPTFLLPTRQTLIRQRSTYIYIWTGEMETYHKLKGRAGEGWRPHIPSCGARWPQESHESLIQVPWSRLDMNAVAYQNHLRRTRFVSPGWAENKSASRFAATFVTASHRRPSPRALGRQELLTDHQCNGPPHWELSVYLLGTSVTYTIGSCFGLHRKVPLGRTNFPPQAHRKVVGEVLDRFKKWTNKGGKYLYPNMHQTGHDDGEKYFIKPLLGLLLYF